MTYIHHLTLLTGHARRIAPGEVPGEVLARVRPWLAALVESGESIPVPVRAVADHVGLASVTDGALILTISGPPHPVDGSRPPLVTMGVAARSRHGAALWPLLTGSVMPPAHPRATKPAEPWCAVVLWPSIGLAPESMHWLGDLERCVAVAWVTA